MSLIFAPIFPSQFLICVCAVKVKAGSVMLYVRSVIEYVIAVMMIVIAVSCWRRNFSAVVNFSGRSGNLFVMV